MRPVIGQTVSVAYHMGDGKWQYGPAQIQSHYERDLWKTNLFQGVIAEEDLFETPAQAFEACQQRNKGMGS